MLAHFAARLDDIQSLIAWTSCSVYPETTLRTLYFYFVYKKDKYRWRLKQIPVVFSNKAERDYWQQTVTTTLLGVRNRPKNIIVFINPFGGKGKAKAIFQKNVSVGGDGLFNELLSGALLRTQKDAGTDIDDPDSEHLQTPHIRFGIIGAGSANSIVSTVHETTDYATAAVHIAIGSECNVDVCTVHENNQLLRISANAISYGWLGDVLRDSERYRCLGPIRYQWSALRTTIRHPIYRGKVSFTLSRKETEDPKAVLPSCLKPCMTCDALNRTLNCFRVLRWSFEPDADQEDPGVWNLDGEILEQPRGRALHFRLHPQLISFFGRDAAMVEPSKRVSFVKKRKSSIVYN
ncbi:hypothetical protein OSTOST_10856 [Ostertagia ostertagi]